MPVKKVKKVQKQKRKRRSSKRRGVVLEDLPKQARMLKRLLVVSTEAGEFLDGCRKRAGLPLSGFIRREHKRVFGTKGLGKYRLPLAKIRVSYQLIYNEYERQNVLDQMPKRFRENCTAVLTGDWSEMNKDTQALYRRAIDVERDVAESVRGRGGVMAKAKKVKKAKKAKKGGAEKKARVTIQSTLVGILSRARAVTTDAAIAEVRKKHPGTKFDEKHLAWYKAKFRKGALSGMNGKPHAIAGEASKKGKKAGAKAKKAGAPKRAKKAAPKKSVKKPAKKVKKVKKVAKKRKS